MKYRKCQQQIMRIHATKNTILKTQSDTCFFVFDSKYLQKESTNAKKIQGIKGMIAFTLKQYQNQKGLSNEI